MWAGGHASHCGGSFPLAEQLDATDHQFPFSQSLGWFYETVAEHLGFGSWTSSGKLMGLAGNGNPDSYTLDFPTARAGGLSRRGRATSS
ncbi:carbamoyltransferase N-terminal domain-containing protein [Streptomyces sp. NPDC058866]|uniref:carbamoyltransferase N-terminal domain-containing protein n=1 Tax=unclassified Streptomyces TaxID=2593676 RepID=UPI0036BED6F6